MDNINYYEAFGLEEPQAQQDAAQDSTGTAPTAAEAAAPAQEAQEAAKNTAPEEDAQESVPEPTEDAKAPQSAEENARQAAGRRIREREAAARDAARAEMSETLRRLGMTNPETGEPVDTVDKLEAYERGLSEARLAKGKATEADVRRVVREEMAGRTAQPAQAGAQNPPASAPTEADFAAEIAEIQRMDPTVKDLKSILDGEAGPKFREYVGKGLNFVEAYTLAARKQLAARQTQAAQEAAQVKAAGKDHLNATQSRGGEGDIPVPQDELELFRAMMPGVSDAEFRKYWNKNRRKG